MSQQEKDEKIDKMASEIGAIKRWYPAFLALCTFATIVFGVTQVWDNKVAKKEDIDKLNNCISALTKVVQELKTEQFQNRVYSSKQRDSVLIVMQNEISSIKKAIKDVKKQRSYKAVAGIKRNGPFGATTFVPVDN